MLSPDAVNFARVAQQLGLLTIEDLLSASAAWGAQKQDKSFPDFLLASGILDTDEVDAVQRAEEGRPADRKLRGTRYELGPTLGKGANGIVVTATDQRLGRDIALKMHGRGSEIGDIELLRFTHEAQVTGQLAHPGIVPVHDLGVLPDGRAYYTMKRIDGRSLKDVFDRLKDGDPSEIERWTVPHLVVTLLRVAQALAYAHDRGVIHRDVKPANIMVGDYGEVLLLDWGVARVLGEGSRGLDAVSTWRSEGDEDLTIDGTVAGTPAYMAPEQARGDIPAITGASDVWSVGIILYEFLVGRRPFRAPSVRELLECIVHDPVAEIEDQPLLREAPLELLTLCMKCLDRDPGRRHRDGKALARALEAYLEGSRRREDANHFVERGLERSAAYARIAEDAREKEKLLHTSSSHLTPWAPVEERRALWREESVWRGLRSRRDDTYDEAVSLLQAALDHDPNRKDARTSLANLYMRRMDESEARGEVDAARFYRSQVLRYDTGVLRRFLEGPSTLLLTTEPAEAHVTLHRLEERDRSLRPGSHRELSSSALAELPLEPGSYALNIQAEGYVSTWLPVQADRPRQLSLQVRLPSLDQLLPGFVFIPAGCYVSGGDPVAIDGMPRAVVEVPDFAIAERPVTQAEFRLWLDAEGTAAGFRCWGGPEAYAPGERDRLPALGVPFPAAQAYAQWRGRITGRDIRLPTHDQWEKAARGVDGRIYPWGDSWEATFANGPEGEPAGSTPRPVGSVPEDRSVYGVCDLAGGVSEWVLGEVPHRPKHSWLRGGSWNSHPNFARLCSRRTEPKTNDGGTLGFRLVQCL